MAFCIGLTGGIGCGKSTVSDLFEKQGAGIVDTDVIAHQLTQTGGAASEQIRAVFGDDFITDKGALDRAKMRALIFSDSSAKQKLEKILHPLIRDQASEQISQLQNRPYVVVVVPLLPESPAFLRMVQRVLVVDCDEDTQVVRVTGRSRLSETEVRAIIAQQTPRTKRLQLADDVIRNDFGMEQLAEQVKVLHESYSGMQNNH